MIDPDWAMTFDLRPGDDVRDFADKIKREIINVNKKVPKALGFEHPVVKTIEILVRFDEAPRKPRTDYSVE